MPGKMVLCAPTNQIWRAILRFVNYMPEHDHMLAYGANVEYLLIISFQLTKGQNKLDVTTAEAMLQCKWNTDCKVFYKKILWNRELFRRAKSSGKILFFKQRYISGEELSSKNMPNDSFISKYLCIVLGNFTSLPGQFISFAKSGKLNKYWDFEKRLEAMNHYRMNVPGKCSMIVRQQFRARGSLKSQSESETSQGGYVFISNHLQVCE